jgi:hypothetical protein
MPRKQVMFGWLDNWLFGHARPERHGSLMTGVWPILLCVLIYLLLLVSALAGVIIGITGSVMAHIANSVKSLFANLLTLPPCRGDTAWRLVDGIPQGHPLRRQIKRQRLRRSSFEYVNCIVAYGMLFQLKS